MTVMAVGGEEAVVAMTSSGVDDGLGLSRAAGRLTKIEGSGGVVLCDSALRLGAGAIVEIASRGGERRAKQQLHRVECWVLLSPKNQKTRLAAPPLG
jgi:hypothetical protein